MAGLFVDTNIFLRHLLADHPEQSPRSTTFLRRVELGELHVVTAETVVFEVVFTLQRSYGLSREDIRDAVVPLINLPGVGLAGKRRLIRAFDLYVDYRLPFADACHAAFMEQHNLDEIVTFDREFDRLPSVSRVEP